MLVLRQIAMRKEPFPSLKLILEMFLIGTLGITTVSFTYFLAIETIDTGLAIVMWYFFPVIVVLISWIVYKKSRRAISLSRSSLALLASLSRLAKSKAVQARR